MTIIEISDENVRCVDRDGIQINGKGFYLVGHLLKSSVNAKLKLKPEPEPEVEVSDNDRQSQKPKKRHQGQAVWTIKKKKKLNDPNKDKPVYKEFMQAHVQSRLVMQGQKYGRMDKNCS
jgi:hypothetical protein